MTLPTTPLTGELLIDSAMGSFLGDKRPWPLSNESWLLLLIGFKEFV
jgi:hypothetical protein